MATITRRSFALGSAAVLGACASGGADLAAITDTADPFDPLAFVDPELRDAARQVMANSPPGGFTAEVLKTARGASGGFAYPRIPDVPVAEEVVPGSKHHPDVKVFVVNAEPGANRPAILHAHGGGYILGSASSEVGYLQGMAKELGCVIVSVEYRLAPETRYDGSLEDNYAGLLWLYRNASSLGVDPGRIALLGESAGGGHAALLAIAARDRGEVPLVLQALIYPMLDDRTGSARSVPPHIGAFGWTAASNRFGWECFLGHAPGRADTPAAGVPARVADVRGLAPAFIGVGGVDLFVDEDIEYARRLTDAGIPAELVLVPGAFHAFDRVAETSAPAQRFTKAKMNALRRAFGQPVIV